MNEGQVLALPFGEPGPGGVTWRDSLIHRCAQQMYEALNIRYRVELHQSERDELTALLAGGRQRIRRLKRAQILLAADRGGGVRRGDCRTGDLRYLDRQNVASGPET